MNARKYLVLLFEIINFYTFTQTRGNDIIYAVNDPLSTDDLKFALTHEHLMSNFGKDMEEAPYYNETVLLNGVVPYLIKLKSLGVHSIF